MTFHCSFPFYKLTGLLHFKRSSPLQTADRWIKMDQKLAVSVFVQCVWDMLDASLRWQPVCLRGPSDGVGQWVWHCTNGCDANDLLANKQAPPSRLLTSDLPSCLFDNLTSTMRWIQPMLPEMTSAGEKGNFFKAH